MRWMSTCLLTITLLVLGRSLLPAADAEAPTRPNILLIMVDDLNDWVGCLEGHPQVQTPHMDALAERGLLFTRAYCPSPLCAPSRTSFWSGLMPGTTGVYGQIGPQKLRRASPTLRQTPYLSQAFAAGGYRTIGVGKLFHGGAPADAFEQYQPDTGFGPYQKRLNWDRHGTSTDWGPYRQHGIEDMADTQTAAWAAERLGDLSTEEPFFLAVGFLRPHVPWYAPKKYFDRYPLAEVQTPPVLADDLADVPERGRAVAAVDPTPTRAWAEANGQWQAIVQSYLACTTYVDEQVGRVLSALEQSPHADNTLVVLVSDHGYHLGEKDRFHKQSLWERSLRVPMIISGPGVVAGERCRQATGLIDLYPTLLAYADLPPAAHVEGTSFLPLLADPDAPGERVALSTFGKANHSIADARFRYTRYADGSEELYDHDSDPHEWHNLIGTGEHSAVVERLRGHLPKENADWSPHSFIITGAFFRQHSPVPKRARKRWVDAYGDW